MVSPEPLANSSERVRTLGSVRVGVYIDGFNLYYGARGLCGRGSSGWRWLNIRGLVSSLLNTAYWPGAEIHRIVYCNELLDNELFRQKSFI